MSGGIVDLAYGTGLLAFDEVCKRVEALALRTEDDARTGYLESKVHLNLFARMPYDSHAQITNHLYHS